MAAAVALLFSACATNPPDAAASQTRIVTWNVLRGFLDRTQVEPAQQWLREQGPDIVALQEVNGFTAARLTEVAAAWGHAHAVMAKESGYPVALTSRSPIEVVERRLAGMHHGYLHARTAGLDVVVVHLNPSDWRFRRREVAVLAPLVRKLVEEGRQVVVLGDFNSHHPLDCEHLDGQRALIERRASGENLIADRTFDYGVLSRFEAAGVTDAAYRARTIEATAAIWRGATDARLKASHRAAAARAHWRRRARRRAIEECWHAGRTDAPKRAARRVG